MCSAKNYELPVNVNITSELRFAKQFANSSKLCNCKKLYYSNPSIDIVFRKGLNKQ